MISKKATLSNELTSSCCPPHEYAHMPCLLLKRQRNPLTLAKETNAFSSRSSTGTVFRAASWRLESSYCRNQDIRLKKMAPSEIWGCKYSLGKGISIILLRGQWYGFIFTSSFMNLNVMYSSLSTTKHMKLPFGHYQRKTVFYSQIVHYLGSQDTAATSVLPPQPVNTSRKIDKRER